MKKQPKKIIEKLSIFLIVYLFLSIFGAFLNTLVVKSNGNKMPVYTKYIVERSDHFDFQNKNKVNFFYLSDIFEFNYKYKSDSYFMWFSIGDVMVVSSVILAFYLLFWFLIEKTKNYKKSRKVKTFPKIKK